MKIIMKEEELFFMMHTNEDWSKMQGGDLEKFLLMHELADIKKLQNTDIPVSTYSHGLTDWIIYSYFHI